MKRNARLLGGVVALSIAAGLPVASYADEITFDFTGTVDSSLGISTASTITGSFTFNYAVADPTLSSGTLSDLTNPVTLANTGGLDGVSPVPTSVVFTSTLDSGALSFSSPLTTATGVLDLVAIIPQDSASLFLGTESWVLADGSEVDNSLTLSGANVFDAAGLPVLNAGASTVGSFSDGAGSVSYHLDTLKQAASAPEIDPASTMCALTLLLGGIAVLRGRRARSDASVIPLALG